MLPLQRVAATASCVTSTPASVCAVMAAMCTVAVCVHPLCKPPPPPELPSYHKSDQTDIITGTAVPRAAAAMPRHSPAQICATLVLLTKRASNVDLRWVTLRVVVEWLQVRHATQPCNSHTCEPANG